MDFYQIAATPFLILAALGALWVFVYYVRQVRLAARERRARREIALARCMAVHPARGAKL